MASSLSGALIIGLTADYEVFKQGSPVGPNTYANSELVSNLRVYDTLSSSMGADTHAIFQYQNGSGNSWVLFKLIASNKSNNWMYWFESANGRDGSGTSDDLRPRLAINQAVPEPSSYALVFGSIALVATMARRRRTSAP